MVVHEIPAILVDFGIKLEKDSLIITKDFGKDPQCYLIQIEHKISRNMSILS